MNRHNLYSKFVLLILCLALTACGFQTVYGEHATNAGPQAEFQDIYVGNIPDRSGQILRNDLIDRLYSHGEPAHAPYYLSIAPLESHITNQAISVTSDATRAELRITTRMTLQDRKTGCILLRRDLLTVNSYNILNSQYTTLVSRASVEENELNDLARQVENQLALYFARTPDPQATLAGAVAAPARAPHQKDMPITPAPSTGLAPVCAAMPNGGATAIDAMTPAAQNLPAVPAAANPALPANTP